MLSIEGDPNSTGGNHQSGLVDALPYIDNEYDEPGMKETVVNLIEEEKRHYRPTKNYLQHLPPLELHRFETELMKTEFDRISRNLPMEVLSLKRYELPPPPAGKLTDIQAWTECVENSHAQLQHQATRIANLDLMLDYGVEGWKSYLTVVNSMLADAEKKLTKVKREIQELNWKRKSGQISAGEELQRLHDSWVGLISKNYEIEQACISKRFVKYQKEAELAQLNFIAREAQSESDNMIS